MIPRLFLTLKEKLRMLEIFYLKTLPLLIADNIFGIFGPTFYLRTCPLLI